MSLYSSMAPPNPYEPHVVGPLTVRFDGGFVQYFLTDRGSFHPSERTPSDWRTSLNDALDSCEGLSATERATVESDMCAIISAPTVRGEMRKTLQAEINAALHPYPEAVRTLKRIPLSEVHETVRELADALRGINDEASARLERALRTLDLFELTL